ncbi:high-affinity branched-chain amino acid ABC transporter, Permease [Candidatus Vecturithrix granuli]|uniref:High-affinity branched-chain amino acid ABC transporter, Permease n=1 Tax=Vecturithrix granuli TaxID=1499967 RepID=A0A081C8R3_VECG1|nr:high-affinity branched-chain amino acid ABC transporter, Permease [Candidatus Vecturithrix granuli]
MKIVKIVLAVLCIFAILLGLQLFYQAKQTFRFIFDEDEIKNTLTQLGAQDVVISTDSIITFTVAQGTSTLQTFQGKSALIPGVLLDEMIEAPEGQELQPTLKQSDNGVFVFVFSSGAQQILRTSEQERLFSLHNALRQIVLQLINGVTLGGVYAMIAVGYTLVYGILMMINFAHGEIFMFGSYGAFFLFSALLSSKSLPIPWILALLAGFIIAMATSALLAVIVERAAYRPLRQAPRLTLLISAIGASIFLQNVMMLITSGRIKYYPEQLLVKGSIPLVGGIAVQKIGVTIIVISILMMLGLYTIIQKTKIGKAIRAVAEDKATASLMGINVNQIVITTFLLGSSMAGAGGLMVGLRDTQINHMMGFLPGMKAFTAAVLGGIGNIPGAMFGGYFLGVAEALGAQFMPAEYKDVIGFTLLVIVLIFRPTGIMGEVLATKKM